MAHYSASVKGTYFCSHTHVMRRYIGRMATLPTYRRATWVGMLKIGRVHNVTALSGTCSPPKRDPAAGAQRRFGREPNTHFRIGSVPSPPIENRKPENRGEGVPFRFSGHRIFGFALPAEPMRFSSLSPPKRDASRT